MPRGFLLTWLTPSRGFLRVCAACLYACRIILRCDSVVRAVDSHHLTTQLKILRDEMRDEELDTVGKVKGHVVAYRLLHCAVFFI